MSLQADIEGNIHGINELLSTHQDQGTGWVCYLLMWPFL